MDSIWALFIPFVIYTWTRSRKRYPPGPKRLPFIGNLLDIPTRHAYEKFAHYSKDLNSDIIYLDAVGVPFIVLNSLEACNDLLEKRSNVYSSRYHQTMAYELIDGKRIFPMLPYGDEWRESKKIMMKHITAPANQEPIFSTITQFIRKSLLPNLLMAPADFLVHIRNGVGGSIISLTYGLPIKRVDDPWIEVAEQSMHCLTSAAVPGKYAVDVVPALKHLPEWLPGAGFLREAKEWKRTFARLFEEPFKAVKKGMVDGTVQPSFLSRSLEEISDMPDQERLERVIENVGGTFLAGGTDTSVTAVTNFVAMLLLFPDIQSKAQAEIDIVIGRHRLPELEDKTKLPYLSAVLKELLRWKPIVPSGLPHMTSEDDIYKDYYIPKGAIVMGNNWAIMHDEKIFPNPSKFDPTRFLTASGQLRHDNKIPDPEVVATFGFGRRICPGINIGLASFWLSAACILACFNVTPELDDEGKPITPKIEYVGKEIVSHPEPFRCQITPRDPEATALVQAEYDESSEYI